MTSHQLRSTLAVVLLFLTAVATVTGIRPAYAAPGDPFNTDDGAVFMAQGYPDTSLYEFVQEGSTATFELVGASPYQYNAIGFNTNDGYVYGIRSDAGAKRELLRIGQGGAITSLGLVDGLPTPQSGYNQGTFGTGANSNILYVRDSGVADRLWAVNVTTKTATVITPNRSVPNLSDIVYRNNVIWGVDSNAHMWRINPSNGVVLDWDVSSILPKEAFGGQWLYGNGNIGLSANATGKIYQISITDATTTTPTFTLVSVVNGQGSSNNDGTAIGGRADLGIVKSAPRVYAEGTELTYTLTVTNHGPGTSTGSIVDDWFPATVDPTLVTTTPGCSFDATYPRKMTCLVGTLAVGESWDIEVTAQTYSNNLDRINTATVAGNEADPNMANNSSTVTSTPARITIDKSVSPTTRTQAGQQVTYSFLVTNRSKADLKDVVVNDTLAAPAGPALNVSCPKTTLAGGTDPNVDGESMTCTATYTVTSADVEYGRINNTATATGTAVLDGSTWTSAESSAVVTIPPITDLSITKTAELVYPEGGALNYVLTVTNNGTGTSSGSTVTDNFPDTLWPDPTTATPGCSFDATYPRQLTCQVGKLAVGESWTINVSAQAYATNLVRVNTATVVANEPDPNLANNTSTFTSTPAKLGIVKSVAPTTVTKAGDQVTYNFLVTNQGKADLKDVVVHDTLTAPAGPALTVSCPKTTLAGGTDPDVDGESMTCTATYTATQADVDRGRIDNTAYASGTAVLDGSSWRSDDSTATVTITQAPGLSVVKSAAQSVIPAAGQSIDYSFLVTNTGNVTLTDVAVDDTLAAPAGPALDVTCPATTLAPAADMTCTATYTVTQADVDHGSIGNTATASGKMPSGDDVSSDPSSVTVTATAPQTPGITVVKSASVTKVTAAGQSIDYSFLVTNTGNVTLSNIAVADQLAAPAGPALAVTCPATVLAPAATTTCMASYTVTQADLNHGSIGNTATATGTPPSGDDVTSDPSTVTVTVTADSLITVVPQAPTMEQTCNAESVVVVPEMTGVVYTTTRDGSTVTVTATAADGYVLEASTVTSWTFDVTALECNGPEIPLTGGTGTALLTLAGLGLLAVTAAAGLWLRRTPHT